MSNYFNNLNPKLKQYFNILSEEIPDFLYKYLDIPELKRLEDVGYFCGMDYCSKDMYDFEFFYSRLDHSIATALITWHHTHDKKQTIAALLHDIATPAFAHTIDYMNGDAIHQESTEERTEEFIRRSKKLLECLNQDGININDVVDCKKYSIVDNDRPKLCADRLDALFITNILWTKKLDINEIKELYNNISIIKDDDGNLELGTKCIPTARKMVDLSVNIGYITNGKEDKLCMDLLANIVKFSIQSGYLFEDELYICGEHEIIEKISSIENREILQLWKTFLTIDKVEAADEIYKKEQDMYYASFENKKKYVDILTLTVVGARRASQIDLQCHDTIESYKNYKPTKWVYTKKCIA